MAESGSLTVYPGAYDASTSSFKSISGATNPVGKGSTNKTYAQIVPTNGVRVASYVYWPFDLSAIPENATIDSVSCSVAARMSSVSGASILTAPIQLFAGSVAKGSAMDVYSRVSAEPFSLSTGTWTRAELKTCRLKTGITRNTSNTSSTNYQLYFYGADLTVTYTYQSEKFMLKLDGAWHDIARVFKKVNGIWVEQTDLANVIEDGVRYQNGGEYVAPVQKRTVTITGTGDATASYVTINGTKYTSAATVQVDDGDVVQATVAGGGFGSTPSISVNGTQKVSGAGTYNHTVTSDCTVNLKVTNEGFGNYGTITITTGGGSSANLISFTIAGTSYQAEEGMTWGEWVASSYNNDGWADVAGKVVNSKDEIVCLGSEYQYAEIKTTDTIISGYAYDITI